MSCEDFAARISRPARRLSRHWDSASFSSSSLLRTSFFKCGAVVLRSPLMVGLVAGSLVPFSAEDVAFRFFLGSSRRNAPQEFKRSRRLAAQPSQGQVTALAEPSLLDDLQQARVVKSGPIAAQINRRADKGGVFPRSKHANGAEPSTDLIDG